MVCLSHKCFRLVWGLCLALLAAACSGGGDSGSAAAGSVPDVAITSEPTSSAAAAALTSLPPGPSTVASGPVILFTDVTEGPVTGAGPGGKGVPITIYGRGFGAARGRSTVTIAGREVESYLVWGEANAANPMLDMIVVQPGPGITTGGPIVVTVNGAGSNADHGFTPNSGRVHYVAAAGTDAAVCTEVAPCRTIQHAMRDVAQGGDTVLVRGPVLDEGEIWLQASHAGSAAARKVVKAYPGERVRLPNASRPFIVGDLANYITVAGFDFENGKSLGIGYDRVVGVHALDNTFRGVIAWDAIGVHGDSIVLAGNVCLVSGSTVGTQGHCYYISHSSGVQIRYNIGAGAPGYGLHIFDQRRSSNDYRRVIRDVLVEGNIFRNSTQRDGMIIAMADEAGLGNTIERVVVRNNVFAANNHNGLRVGADAGATIREVTIHANTFYRNGRQGLHVFNGASTGQFDIRGNLFDQSPNANCVSTTICSWYQTAHVEVAATVSAVRLERNFYFPGSAMLRGVNDSRAATGDLSFVAPDSFDLRPRPGSAAIDGSDVLPGLVRDFLGVPRPRGGGVDFGAFEAGG